MASSTMDPYTLNDHVVIFWCRDQDHPSLLRSGLVFLELDFEWIKMSDESE